MRSGLIAVMHKELKRFFTDSRMVVTTIFMPGILIFLLYTFMGTALSASFSVSDDYKPVMYAVNMPDSLQEVCTEAGLPFEEVNASEVEGLKERIELKEADLLVMFPADFDTELVATLGMQEGGMQIGGTTPSDTVNEDGEINGSSLSSSESGLNIEIFYNSTRVESNSAYSQLRSLLDSYKDALLPLFSVNAADETYDLASEEDSAGFLFSALLPMIMMIFLFSGCMAVAPESIAGEKERGTIATLLVTPLKRWELALGKIISLCIIALLSGISSFLGTILSLPSLMGMTSGEGEGGFSFSSIIALYSPVDLLLLFAVIISTVLLFVGLISILSAFARTIKEASTMVTPLMIVVTLVGVTGMFQTSSDVNVLIYLIPVYNSVQSMVAIFSFNVDTLAILLTVAVNLIVAVICVVVLTRMFNSERIVFNK